MEEAMDIRGLKGAVEIPVEVNYWPWVLAGLGVLALLGALWFLLKGRKRSEEARVLSARERAVAAIDVAREMKDPERSREFAYAVSDAVRAFLEERFGLPTTRQTTEEFLRTVAGGGVGLGPYRATLGEFLGHCDRGKFGKWEMGEGELDALERSALDVVNAEFEEATKGGEDGDPVFAS